MSGTADAAGGPWLVVGLGNPGPRYAGTRHNVGARVVTGLAAGLGARLAAHRSRAQVAEVRLPALGGRPGERVVLAVPTAFMNESGGQVASVLTFYKVPPERLVVVHDDLELAFGDLVLKRGGGEGGHNGLRSVTRSVGTRDYGRLRFGIGRPPGRTDPADFVLRDFSPAERKDLDVVVADAEDAARSVAELGWDAARAALEAQRKARHG